MDHYCCNVWGEKNCFFAWKKKKKKKSASQPSAIPLLTNLYKLEEQTHVKIAFFSLEEWFETHQEILNKGFWVVLGQIWYSCKCCYPKRLNTHQNTPYSIIFPFSKYVMAKHGYRYNIFWDERKKTWKDPSMNSNMCCWIQIWCFFFFKCSSRR